MSVGVVVIAKGRWRRRVRARQESAICRTQALHPLARNSMLNPRCIVTLDPCARQCEGHAAIWPSPPLALCMSVSSAWASRRPGCRLVVLRSSRLAFSSSTSQRWGGSIVLLIAGAQCLALSVSGPCETRRRRRRSATACHGSAPGSFARSRSGLLRSAEICARFGSAGIAPALEQHDPNNPIQTTRGARCGVKELLSRRCPRRLVRLAA